ncbi:MAG TPA: hypothetical protein DCG57_02820 [Candidatus Riflebacteria bacterium]|jgi:ComEC/Rec2-related protein|nr:hypothetical protein [Candidatus Riflebacteria bacterium]
MEKPSKRPEISVPHLETLPVFVVFFAIGISAAELFVRDIAWVFCSLTLFSIMLSLPDFLQKFRWHFLVIAALSVGVFYALAKVEPGYDFAGLLKLDGVEGRLTGTFRGEYHAGKSGAVSFKMVNSTFEFDEQLVSMPALIDCRISKSELLPEPEQLYSCTGKFSINQVGRAPVFRGTGLQPTSNSFNRTGWLAGTLQQKIRDSLKSSLPARHAAIATGFILGDTSGISREDRQLFKETGVSHLLAVSGQHLMVLVVLLTAIFHWLKIPPVSRSILTILILSVYAMTTSGSPSVWRALTMYFCLAAVLHLEANPSPIRPVTIAALILLLYDPAILSNAAFQLSFAAVIGILYLRQPIERLFNRLYFPINLSRYFAVSLAANLATIPMTALIFGTVSLAAIIVNPLILWVFGYILPASFLIVLLSVVWPTMTLLVSPALCLVMDGLIALLQSASKIPGHFFYVGNISGITIAGCFALLLYAVSLVNKRDIGQTENTVTGITITRTKPEANSAVRAPAFTGRQADLPAMAIEVDKPAPPDYRLSNPFRNDRLIRDIDTVLLGCRRRPIKSPAHSSSELLPISLLSIDNQNLYHQLVDLDSGSLKLEPERILQAHIYLMSLVGGEIINRIGYHLFPPPQPGDVCVEHVIRDRHLAISVLADSLLNSQLLTRATDESFMLIISRAQAIYSRARNQLERMLNGTSQEVLDQHLSLRRDLLCWCREFIEFDIEARNSKHNDLRPEQ